MTFNRDSDYWENKLKAYLHDPFDKALRIQGHDEQAKKYLEVLNCTISDNEQAWKEADRISASFERGMLPRYSGDSVKNGAADFLSEKLIIHPLSKKENSLRLDCLPSESEIGEIEEEICRFMKNDVQVIRQQQKLSPYLHFLYLHLVLRFRLAASNVGHLGPLWHRMPADTRIPDHSIWQHNALTSAFYSSAQDAAGSDKVGLMVFSMTPVQAFIATARKLQDYWTGSVILSWLAFGGIRWVIEHFGPDHLVYPSLIDQPLVLEFLKQQDFPQEWLQSMNSERSVASFPNKFMFIVPLEQSEEIGQAIQEAISNEWKELYHRIGELLPISGDESENLNQIFERQCADYWDFTWATVPLLEHGGIYKTLLSPEKHESSDALFESFKNIFDSKYQSNKNWKFDSKGLYYSTTHSLLQSVLAAEKSVKDYKETSENGEKCHLCGERGVVHPYRSQGWGAKDYKKKVKAYWDQIYSLYSRDLNEGERLCSVCLSKRLAYRVFEKDRSHVLHATFKEKGGGFPSTTEMALKDYLDAVQIPSSDRADIAQHIHDPDSNDLKWGEIVSKFPKLKGIKRPQDEDFYYAILMMDGDEMGKLINGETIGATWESVLAPSLVERMKGGNGFTDKVFVDNWKTILTQKRSVTPAIHAAISEALGDFSVYQVPAIVGKHKGTLIYAGGDDVCAVFPVSTVLDAADEIRKAYTQKFYEVTKTDERFRTTEIKGEVCVNKKDTKLSIGMGSASKISISAGVLICHHKESLSDMIRESHTLLNSYAKKHADRNAVAIELRKRSGGSRYFSSKWGSQVLEEFKSLIKDKHADLVSSSLLYRLERYQTGMEVILQQKDLMEIEKNKQIKDFVAYHVKHSGKSEKIGKEKIEEIATRIATLIFPENKNELSFEPLVIASFLSKYIKYRSNEENDTVEDAHE